MTDFESSSSPSPNDFSRIFSAREITSVGVSLTTEMSQPELLPFASQSRSATQAPSPSVAEEKKKTRAPLKVKPKKKQLAFFNSLHTDARFHVGAIRYYVSLHTPAASTFYAFLCFKTRFSFSFFPFYCSIPCAPISLFLYGNQL